MFVFKKYAFRLIPVKEKFVANHYIKVMHEFASENTNSIERLGKMGGSERIKRATRCMPLVSEGTC